MTNAELYKVYKAVTRKEDAMKEVTKRGYADWCLKEHGIDNTELWETLWQKYKSELIKHPCKECCTDSEMPVCEHNIKGCCEVAIEF